MPFRLSVSWPVHPSYALQAILFLASKISFAQIVQFAGSYPTMHHSEQKCAHFCSERCIVRYGTGAL